MGSELDPGDLHAPSQGKQADLGQKWLWIALGQLEGLNCCVFFCVLDGWLAPPLKFFLWNERQSESRFLGCNVAHLFE